MKVGVIVRGWVDRLDCKRSACLKLTSRTFPISTPIEQHCPWHKLGLLVDLTTYAFFVETQHSRFDSGRIADHISTPSLTPF